MPSARAAKPSAPVWWSASPSKRVDKDNGDTARILTGKLDHTVQYFVTSSTIRPEQTIREADYNAALQIPTLPNDGAVTETE